ncbi:TetR/AcrR family transcriptional regulator [Gordonia humi]|uniref:AcrR family transcriptional regulator n=1 Tax=Gordonia humi TaxID=686429 RepID=A0A840F0A8_9ACTN|nr:TetR/AcrR family transcriptional regulator [Gordonia humi]MBB4135436.1 AcrR family transcriptional regulator [Gordonia humi]
MAQLSVADGAKLRILDAAATAFHEQGFAQTTIDDIAARLGATKGLIYYHYRSKFDIFLAVYEFGMTSVRTRVEPFADEPGTGFARLTAMTRAHAFYLLRHIAYHNTIRQGVHHRSTIALKPKQVDALGALNDLRDDFEAMFHRVIVDGIADGTIRDEDPGLLTRTLLSSVSAIDQWFRPRDDQTDDDLTALSGRIATIILGGLSAETTPTDL